MSARNIIICVLALGLATVCGRAAEPAAKPAMRSYTEAELKEQLTAVLQEEYVKDRGELELHFPRAWTAVNVPDEPLKMKILEIPTAGVSAFFIVRFELSAGGKSVGNWQATVQAKIWREVWTAHSAVKRGDALEHADLQREKRDLLALREPLTELPSSNMAYEFAESLTAGMVLSTRSIKLKPVVRRGQSAEAFVSEGAMSISLKVEVLEDGVPGQTIRVRNPQSRRELRGQVANEQTILINL